MTEKQLDNITELFKRKEKLINVLKAIDDAKDDFKRDPHPIYCICLNNIRIVDDVDSDSYSAILESMYNIVEKEYEEIYAMCDGYLLSKKLK